MNSSRDTLDVFKLFCYCFIFTLTLLVFYNMSVEGVVNLNGGNYVGLNDFGAHIYWAHEAGIKNLFTFDGSLSYPLFHMLVYYLTRFILPSFEVSSAFVCASSIVASIAILDHFMRKHLKDTHVSQRLVFGLSCGLIVFMALYIPSFNQIYLGQPSGQPWHSPTYVIMKPFAIFCFFWLYELFSIAKEERVTLCKRNVSKQNLYFLIFSIVLLLSVLAKPSFIFCFGPAAFIFTVIELIRSKMKIFYFCCKLSLSTVPSIILLFIQKSMTMNQHNASLVFAPLKVWNIFSTSIPLSFLLCFAFPIYVIFLLNNLIFKDKLFFFSLLIGLVGVLEFSLLAESGDRFSHGNIGWSLMCSSLLLFAVCTIMFLRFVQTTGMKRHKLWVTGCGFVLLFLHISNGIYYFWEQFQKLGN